GEGVPGLRFVRGSASRLPFADADFERVVSCLTFHEVRDVADKTVSVAEALRVLAPGGSFAFVDLFDDPKLYHGRGRVLKVIVSNGGEIASSRSLCEVLDLRFPLNLTKVLKYAVLVSGTKSFATEHWGAPLAQESPCASAESRIARGRSAARSRWQMRR